MKDVGSSLDGDWLLNSMRSFFLVVHAEVYGVSNLNVFLLWEILRELEKKETQNAVSFKIGLAVFLLWYL